MSSNLPKKNSSKRLGQYLLTSADECVCWKSIQTEPGLDRLFTESCKKTFNQTRECDQYGTVCRTDQYTHQPVCMVFKVFVRVSTWVAVLVFLPSSPWYSQINQLLARCSQPRSLLQYRDSKHRRYLCRVGL